MNQNRLNLIKFCEWTIWMLLITVLIGLFYHSKILKNIHNQIIESILVIVCLISLISLRKYRFRLQISLGLFKAYGESFGFNSIMLINIGLGLIWIVLGFLKLSDINGLVFEFTLGLGFIIGGLSNGHRYYLKINGKTINKLELDSIKISTIELITFSSDKIVLKTAQRTMEIYYGNLKQDEKQLVLNDFEEIKIKNNLT